MDTADCHHQYWPCIIFSLKEWEKKHYEGHIKFNILQLARLSVLFVMKAAVFVSRVSLSLSFFFVSFPVFFFLPHFPPASAAHL